MRASHARRPPAREGGRHAENTRGLTLLLVQPRIGPDRAGADRQPQKQRERDHLRRGLSPKPIQPAQSDQQIERQAPGADLDHEPFNDAGEMTQPSIYNGIMYVVNGNWTFALDVATGQPIWRTPVEYERAAARVGTAGALMRGGATI